MVASDCIYFPGAHKSLLSSASKCVGEGGLWVVGFSLHGNVKEVRMNKGRVLLHGTSVI